MEDKVPDLAARQTLDIDGEEMSGVFVQRVSSKATLRPRACLGPTPIPLPEAKYRLPREKWVVACQPVGMENGKRSLFKGDQEIVTLGLGSAISWSNRSSLLWSDTDGQGGLEVKRMASLTISLVLITSAFCGCTRRMIDFTVISSKNVHLNVPESGVGPRVQGKHQVYWLIVIPMGTPNIKEATDKAIESAGPGYDALIDGVVYYYEYWYVATGVSGYKVEGTAINTKMLTSLNGEGRVPAGPILYHSSRGISNAEALAELGIVTIESRTR